MISDLRPQAKVQDQNFWIVQNMRDKGLLKMDVPSKFGTHREVLAHGGQQNM
jgi:hypothetical protein